MKVDEASFMTQVKALAFLYNWKVQHLQPMRTPRGKIITGGSAGFPDLVLAHPDRGTIFAELKTETNKLSDPQVEWLKALVNSECHVWRPSDLPSITDRLSRNIDRRSG